MLEDLWHLRLNKKVHSLPFRLVFRSLSANVNILILDLPQASSEGSCPWGYASFGHYSTSECYAIFPTSRWSLVYALIVEIKNENPDNFELIVPFLCLFHAQMSFISAIDKHLIGSGLAKLLVAADMIAEGYVVQALNGKHYKRSIRCLKLTYKL